MLTANPALRPIKLSAKWTGGNCDLILSPQYGLVWAEDVLTESLYAGPVARGSLASYNLFSLFALFPKLLSEKVSEVDGPAALSYAKSRPLPRHLNLLSPVRFSQFVAHHEDVSHKCACRAKHAFALTASSGLVSTYWQFIAGARTDMPLRCVAYKVTSRLARCNFALKSTDTALQSAKGLPVDEIDKLSCTSAVLSNPMASRSSSVTVRSRAKLLKTLIATPLD